LNQSKQKEDEIQKLIKKNDDLVREHIKQDD